MAAPHGTKTVYLVLTGYLLASGFAALVGGYFTAQVTITALYAALTKPSWSPPGWLFGPVWSLLYVSMSLAMWLVWQNRSRQSSKVYTSTHVWWWGQLVLNAAWPCVFWLQPAGMAAFVVCALLAISVWFCTAKFQPFSSLAVVLMLPYAMWVSFATALSWTLWRMNSAL